MKRTIYQIVMMSLIFFVAACAVEKKPERYIADTGSIVTQAEWPDDVSSDLVTVRIIISASDMKKMSQDFKFSDRKGVVYGIQGVPVGDKRTLIIEGLNSDGTKLYEGSATNITVAVGQMVDCGLIVMNPKAPKVLVAKAPANVKAEAGDGRVTIRWDRVSGADSYGIYLSRSPGASKRNFDARKTTTSTSYQWTGLKNGTTYYFIVISENRYGDSNESIEVKSIPKAPMVSTEAPKVVAKPPMKPTEAPKVVPVVPVPKAPPILDPNEILLKADQIKAPGQSFSEEITITFKKGQESTVNKMSLRVKDFSKSLVIYKYPLSQKGRVLLMVENNMWIYFPGTRRAIRISPAQQLLGQVANADVSRVVFNLDYEAESVKEDNTGNKKLLKVFLKAKTEAAAYGSIKLWMEKDSFKLVKADFFTLTGRLLKTIYYKGYKHILGKERPTIYEIHDAINTSEISIMEFSEVKVVDTPDHYFQKTFMPRVPGLNL